ncbi:oxygenase MpaB family protein [Streptomyces bacillaris]|uniref:oxygenase MpaB family protein n=1 Tax=Streptomyces bacillaris TaxID=68179 RepID=UPI003460F96F
MEAHVEPSAPDPAGPDQRGPDPSGRGPSGPDPANPTPTPTGPRTVEPLGPDSLTWRWFGDWRGLLLAPWAGSMQNMHPELGAGVAQHSRFFEERWERLFRSLYPIGGVVYDGPLAARTAREVRGYHASISGVDEHGRPYHALNPGTFYWAHATFFMLTVRVAECFGGGLTEAQRHTLFDEHVRWYALYGLSMKPVPGSWEEFQRYWDHMCAHVLEDNRPTRDVLNMRRIARPPLLRRLPEPLWAVLRVPMVRLTLWITVGLYPQAVRERLGLRWTPRDERLLRALGRVVHHVWRCVPERYRFHPRARAGWERERGRPVTGPVETPARNLPPEERRGLPQHYVPGRRSP